MANYVLENCKFYVEGFDLSGATNKGTLKLTRDAKESTTFGSGGAKEYKAGLVQANLSLGALYDPIGIDADLDTLYGATGQTMTVAPTTGAAGEIAYSFNANISDIERTFQVGELGMLPWSAISTGAAARTTVVEDGTTARTSTGTGTAFNLGAVSSTQTVFAALHVLSVAGTGSPTITAKIQSAAASGFGTPHDQITFTASTAPSGEFKSLAGANTDTWWRLSWTITGSSPSFIAVATVGIQ